MEDMYDAYRKAKVDVFFERSQPMALEFCEYEQALHSRLQRLQAMLRSPRGSWYQDSNFIGTFGYIPKNLKIPPPEKSNQPHFSQSDPEDSWKDILRRCKSEKPGVEFRPVAHFTVDMYVICALWVNLVGHKFDACLEPCARGTRLRRLRVNGQSKGHPAPYHVQAPGSFQPYFECYREWREQGLTAIRNELTEGRRVVAITMDLTSFYHNIDPRFSLNPEFLKKLRFRTVNRQPLTETEELFTEQLVTAFETWSTQLPHLDVDGPAGVPVGPSAARIMANVLLAEFDRLVQRNLAPIYYGRYVDDVFLVLRDTGALNTPEKVVTHLASRITRLKLNEDRSELRLDLPYAGKSILLFKTEKQHVFLLSGEIGEDLLDTIESKIAEVSSEWRLLPDLDALERSPAAQVLTAATKSNEDADSLRRADQLSLRRLGFALLLRNVDALARDLPPKEWLPERMRFYRFIFHHVLTPLRLLDLHDYLPRLLSLAVACRDWNEARRIALRIVEVAKDLKANVEVEPSTNAEQQWDGFERHLKKALLEAVVRAYPFQSTSKTLGPADRVIDVINELSPDLNDFFAATCGKRAKDLFLADLSRTAFKEPLIEGSGLPTSERAFDLSDLPPNRAETAGTIVEFLRDIGVEVRCLIPLLFPTRPLNAPEITERLPNTAEDLVSLSKFVRALRGTWVKPNTTGESNANNQDVLEIGTARNEFGQDRNNEFSDG